MRRWHRWARIVLGFVVPLVAVYRLWVSTQPVHHVVSDAHVRAVHDAVADDRGVASTVSAGKIGNDLESAAVRRYLSLCRSVSRTTRHPRGRSRARRAADIRSRIERTPDMPAKNAQPTTDEAPADGFTEQERAAMQQRAAELRAEGRKGAKRADGLQAVLDAIAKMAPEDRALAERVHVAVTSAAPQLAPKTWYGMPAYADEAGKVVVFFQDSGKFNYRYSTLGFQDSANLDDGDLWPVSYALQNWTPAVEEKVVALVRAAVS